AVGKGNARRPVGAPEGRQSLPCRPSGADWGGEAPSTHGSRRGLRSVAPPGLAEQTITSLAFSVPASTAYGCHPPETADPPATTGSVRVTGRAGNLSPASGDGAACVATRVAD